VRQTQKSAIVLDTLTTTGLQQEQQHNIREENRTSFGRCNLRKCATNKKKTQHNKVPLMLYKPNSA